jgi:hypothetical protein
MHPIIEVYKKKALTNETFTRAECQFVLTSSHATLTVPYGYVKNRFYCITKIIATSNPRAPKNFSERRLKSFIEFT